MCRLTFLMMFANGRPIWIIFECKVVIKKWRSSFWATEYPRVHVCFQTWCIWIQWVISLAASALSTSTVSTFCSVFATSQPSQAPPPSELFPVPVIRHRTSTACKLYTATSELLWLCSASASAAIVSRWAPFVSLGLEQSFNSNTATPSTTPSISGCRSSPSNRMEFSWIQVPTTVLVAFYKSVLFFSSTVTGLQCSFRMRSIWSV